MTIYDLPAEIEKINWVPNALSTHYFNEINANYLSVLLLFGIFALFEFSFCECFE